jgi:hypothetical protein
MNRKEKFNQVEIVKRELIKAGLIDKVMIGAYLMENYVGKKTLHIKAEYQETVMSYIPEEPYIEKTTKKIEEINKYFSGKVFAAGIVQRKEWLLATPAERHAFMNKNGGNIIACHPSNYK